MACSVEYIDYIKDNLPKDLQWEIKKMFGDYGLYCNDKFIGLICDNQLFIKVLKQTEKYETTFCLISPYPSAKEHFLIEEVLSSDFIELIEATLPYLKMKKK